MSQMQITDEELMAFADGAMSEPRFTEVAKSIEQDAALANRLEELVLGGKAARALYAPIADQPVPDALRRNVEAANAGEGPARVLPLVTKRTRFFLLPMAIAASIAVVVAGPLAFFIGQVSTPVPLLALGEPLSPVLSVEVSSLASGNEARLANEITLRAIASFTDREGRLCREFELHGARSQLAVACREPDGWRTMIALDVPPDFEGYTPASALEALDSFLAGLGAGPPLSPENEARLLAGHR